MIKTMKREDNRLLWFILCIVALDVISTIMILGFPGVTDESRIINSLYSFHPMMVVVWLPFVMLIAWLFMKVSEYLKIMSHFRFTCVLYGFIVIYAVSNNISIFIGRMI